ncbi:sulfite exporter TauE/SafE family protein [Vibrio penaeicida]|uniref:sulfite exporter TauE/SafE family protein n=1 Tax=Vibrio penaeicida TaxID=104609 RepID=UPI000CEA2B96|nr:sulfite exporter TauE/SafE family protein [Vibrio penaeicida]
MIVDPFFYLVAVPAILIYGIGKGGFGGAIGSISVPMMSLTISPIQAAAILLPILIVMDIFAVKHHYRTANYSVIRSMLAWAIIGIVVAGLLLDLLSIHLIKALIGGISVLFCCLYWFGISDHAFFKHSKWRIIWSCLCGFSSTAIHSGGGPATIYLLPLKLDKVVLVSTMAVLFAILNGLKLVPYGMLGSFSKENLMTAFVLAPLSPIGVYTGVWLLNRVSEKFIYQVCYVCLFVFGTKLLLEGILL